MGSVNTRHGKANPDQFVAGNVLSCPSAVDLVRCEGDDSVHANTTNQKQPRPNFGKRSISGEGDPVVPRTVEHGTAVLCWLRARAEPHAIAAGTRGPGIGIRGRIINVLLGGFIAGVAVIAEATFVVIYNSTHPPMRPFTIC